MTATGILSGPSLDLGVETYTDHVGRIGALPLNSDYLIEELEAAGLRGRGGAGFPAGVKWTAVRKERRRPVIVANGAEGEPLSLKDRTVMTRRPHLVIDGAVAAARALRAREIYFYIGADHSAAMATMSDAIAERPEQTDLELNIILAPARFVSGEESAVVHCINERLAVPTTKPPRPFQKGVGGAPTLVQNVETLAHAALIARRGAGWFQDQGEDGSAGTTLLTVSGSVSRPGVLEVPTGITVERAVELAGGLTESVSAALVGGYFGGWVPWETARSLVLDAAWLRARGRSLGCGIINLLPARSCGVVETARIMQYLADESARQCGPCTFGLRAMSDVMTTLAQHRATSGDFVRLTRWGREIRGRGACAHPDGAAGLLESALLAFEDEFIRHQERAGCGAAA